MSPERINPKTIREIKFKEGYQDYCFFMAKGPDGFYIYNTSDIEDLSKSINGPKFNVFSDVFVNNNKGTWEKTNPGCSGVIKFYLSHRMPVHRDTGYY